MTSKEKFKYISKIMLQSIMATRYVLREEKMISKDDGNRFKINRHGFTSEKASLYNFSVNNPDYYLNDYQRYKCRYINGSYSILLDDKLITTKMLNKYNALPEIYGSLNNNIMIKDELVSFENFLKHLKEVRTMILKPVSGGGGKGVYLLEYSNKIKLNYKEVSHDVLSYFISSLNNYYISEVIDQSAYAKNIFPNTVNTIRILMMRDPDTQEFFIATAVHKFGSSTTGSADNVWRGGLTAMVDLDTGILGKPALHKKHNREFEWVSGHPDTGAKIEGVKVPNWKTVKEKIIQMSNEFPMLDYIGWDAVVTDDGVRLIEGNNYSEVSILQIHKPLLENSRIKRFYQYHGIVK